MPVDREEHARLTAHLSSLVGTRLLDPLEILLDTDLPQVRRRVAQQVVGLADQLLGSDEQLAMATAIRLVSSLYPSDGPFDPPVQWWATPLGQVVARLVGHPGTDSLSYAQAGAMLGITRQGVHDLVVRGKLERHSSGGVSTASVRTRISSRAATRRTQRGE